MGREEPRSDDHGAASGGIDRNRQPGTLSVEFSGWLGPLLFRLFRKLNEQYVTTEAQSLKKRCES
jgi:hypothetical protein